MEEEDWPGGRRTRPVKTKNEAGEVVENTVTETLVGQRKGLLQIAWERGFDIEKPKKNGTGKVRKTAKELKDMLIQCEDFANEVSALEHAVLSRGHLLIMSPKGHPELAGSGIEYGWGRSKYLFRKHNPGTTGGKQATVDLHERVVKSLASVSLESVRRFARKTREYRRAYIVVDENNEGNFSAKQRHDAHMLVRKFEAKAKTHRCTLDQDFAFVTARQGPCEDRQNVEGPKGYGEDDETEDGDAQACHGDAQACHGDAQA